MKDFGTCPRCGAPTKTATAFNGGESKFWKECTNIKCNTYINTYIPLAHQSAFHADAHPITANFGGYGSGKTTASTQEFYKHIFITPFGVSLIGANVASQYEQTIKRDIESDLPKDFYKDWSTQKQFYDFQNGHRLLYRPFDDANKLRSYNVSMFLMLEASEINAEVYDQLKTRLRNLAGTKPKLDKEGNIVFKKIKSGDRVPVLEHNWNKGIIESNPSSGWIRNDVLLCSEQIHTAGTIRDLYQQQQERIDRNLASYVTSTDANAYLPDNFIELNSKNKPLWWTNRYIYGSFLYAEGLVYPSLMQHVVDPFEIPKHWRRIIAFDYGLTDPSVYLFGAVDMKNGVLYIYKEARTTNKSVQDLAKLYFQNITDVPAGGMICPPIIDPKSGPKRDYEKKTLGDHFLEYGIYFMPGFVNKDARIFRTNTYLESGRLKIFRNCVELIKEGSEYKYQTERGASDMYTDKPVDKNDHGISCIEWICMELPPNPANIIMGVYDKMGRNLKESIALDNPEEAYGFHALSDDKEEFE